MSATLQDLERFAQWHERTCKAVETEIRAQLAARANTIDDVFRGHTPVHLLNCLADHCLGGKMFRAAFVELGYCAAGGESVDDIRPLQAAVEILHTAVLVHDDIIDRSIERRKRTTLHKELEALCPDDSSMERSHFGTSMALLSGDIGCFIAMSVALRGRIAPEAHLSALMVLFDSIIETALGEVLDVEIAANPSPSEDDIYRMTAFKTSNYTVLAPLRLGELAATGRDQLGDAFRGFALKLGRAYQLRDDYLGIFGSRDDTGKPEESDLREGKKTFLWLWATEIATTQQRDQINKLYGSPSAGPKEVEQIRRIFRDLKIDQRAKSEVGELVIAAGAAIPAITRNEEFQACFRGLCHKILL